jgi:MarR family transcriptional regulator, lower aerobic nicotinate degradation pathway regulator
MAKGSSSEAGPPEGMWRLPTWLVNQAAHRAYRLVSDALSERDAHTSHFALLCALDEFGTSSQATLGRRLGMDRSDVVGALNELQRRGLIVRVQDESDRRRNAVSLTAKGRLELGRLIKLVDRAQEEAFDFLSESERSQLEKLLRRVVEHHSAWQRPSRARPELEPEP